MLLRVRTATRDRGYALVKLYLVLFLAPNDLLFTAVHAVFDDSRDFVMVAAMCYCGSLHPVSLRAAEREYNWDYAYPEQ